MQGQTSVGAGLMTGLASGILATLMWRMGESGEIAGALFGLAGGVTFLRACHLLARREIEIAKFRRGIRIVRDFGGAKWATLRTVRRLKLLGKKGIYLGRFRGREIRYDGPSSVAIVAQSRSGKGTDFILPTLLTCDRNMFLCDPKGELAAMTAAFRREKMQHAVFFVNPWGLHGLGNNPYNPLDEIAFGDRNIRPYAAAVAAALLPESARPGDISSSFWRDHGRNICTGLILWMKAYEPDNCNLVRLRALTHLHDRDFKALFQSMAAGPPGMGTAPSPFTELLREFANPVLSGMASEKQHAGVIAEAQRATAPFDGLSELSDSLRSSDFSFADFKHRRMTVYVMIPTNMIRVYERWYQLLVDTAVERVARENGK